MSGFTSIKLTWHAPYGGAGKITQHIKHLLLSKVINKGHISDTNWRSIFAQRHLDADLGSWTHD